MTPDVDVLCHDYLPSLLAPILKENGIEKTILVQASNSIEETRWLLSLADEEEFVAGVVGWVDFQSADIERQLNEFAAHPKFKGVRHLVESEPKDDWLIQESVLNGLRELSSRGLSYDLLVHTRHLKYATTVTNECPEVRFVIDHMAKPPIASREIDVWTTEMKKIASNANVFCKLSGLVTEADWTNWRADDLKPYLEVVLECFGPKRMMFGSDWPVCLLAASYGKVLEAFQTLLAELNDEDRSGIFADNAIEFYRIDEQAIAA